MKLPTTNYQLQTQKGFTLIEAVVAASVFAFVVASTLGVYLAVLQLDSKTRATRAVAQNARFIMEFLAKEIRNGTIDYSAAQSPTQLSLINQAGDLEQFFLQGQNVLLSKSGVGTTNLNSSSVTVTRLQFSLSPIVDPFTTAKLSNQQPFVTVVLELTSNFGNKASDIARVNLQSTFASRDYPSRLP